MNHLYINGWHAGLTGVGQGSYAARLLEGIDRHLRIDDGQVHLLTTCDAAPVLKRLLSRIQIDAIPFDAPGHPVLANLAWHHRLLSDRRLFDASSVFFSPGPCWGLKSPPRMAVTFHDCIYRHFPVYLGRRGVRKWLAGRQEKYAKNAGVIFTQSDHAKDDITRQTGVDPRAINVIPAWLPPTFNGKPAQAGTDAARERYQLPERYWLYVGGYDFRKNVAFLIKAYAAAAKSVHVPPLVLAGMIPQQRSASMCDVAGAISASGLDEKKVRMPGFIADEDLPALYGGAELFIFPSLMEGYGLPALEALGCGCPALVADNSSLREVVPDQNYRFDTRDPALLAEKLCEAAKEPLAFPSFFKPREHDEAVAIRRYLSALAELGKAQA